VTDSDGFNERQLRDALASFATGVTVVTAVAPDGEPRGMTASSFNSVSMDPPLILWSVTKSSRSAEVFSTARHFNVHVLSADQVQLSNHFASSGVDKFKNIVYQHDENNVPVLAESAALFHCRQIAPRPPLKIPVMPANRTVC